MEYKLFPVQDFEFKADGSQPGYFKALVAVFGNVDDGGDRIVSGAFRKTLKSNPKPPIVWSHQWNIPPIGQTITAKETDAGLQIEGQLLLDDQGISGQYAHSVLSGFKAGVLKEFSFAFDVTDSADVVEKNQNIRELRGVNVFEVGPTLVGMNRDTQLLEVAGRGDLDELAEKIAKRLKANDIGRTFYVQRESTNTNSVSDVWTRAAIGSHSTATTEGTWDGNAAMTRASNAADPAAAFRGICAWYAGDNPEQRGSYKFPHHNSTGGPAVLPGVRNALARVPQANIPSSDVSGVEAHLNRHLNDAKSQLNDEPSGQLDDELRARITRTVELMTAQPY